LSREVGDAPSLEPFKAGFERALSTLVWWKMSLLMAGGLGQMIFKAPFQSKLFYDSMKILCKKKQSGYNQKR